MKNNNSQVQFRHLNQNDRDRIQILVKQGMFQKDIAEVLGVDPSSVCRELKRKTIKYGYLADAAQHKANILRNNSKYQGMKIQKDTVLRERITTELETYASPDEISGSLKSENIHIGKDAIYKWIYSAYGNHYTKYLCTKRHRKRKHKTKTQRTLIPNRISITERPEDGMHGEADCFVSPKKAHTTTSASMLVIQKTKLMQGNIIPNLKPQTMLDSIMNILSKTNGIDDITFDNGIENRKHEQLSVRAYFCDPYSPWQKPLVEGSIGLLRRWCYPKGTDLSLVSDEEYQAKLNFLNYKKSKSLGYRSAYEVSLECGIIKELPERIAFQRRI